MHEGTTSMSDVLSLGHDSREAILQLAEDLSADAPLALIFRMRLLAFSETFIRAQAGALRRYRPFFLGIKKVPGLSLPKDASWVANEGSWLGAIREVSFRFLGPGAQCRQLLARLKPELIHAHFGADTCEAIPLAKAAGVPLIGTFHGYDATLTDEGLKRTRHGRTYLRHRPQLRQNVALYLAVSNFIHRRLLERGVPADRIRTHYIGVDLNEFQPAPRSRRGSAVLFVGRLVEKKGCSFFLKAMAEVQKTFPECQAIIAGDGPQRQELEAQAAGSLRNYKFLGAQPAKEIKEWMRKARVFCAPSITAEDGDMEGFGMVFAEAQASGLPVVSFASGGIPEVVEHNETGLLTAEKDWRGLASSIALLHQNDSLWDRFSHAGTKRVRDKFDLERQTRELENIYDEVRRQSRLASQHSFARRRMS